MNNQQQDLVLVYWNLFTRHKILIFMVVTVFVLGSVALALTMKPVFRAEILIAPISENNASGRLSRLASQFGDLAALGGIDISGSGGSAASTALAMLGSRQFNYYIIQEMHLLQKMYPDRWNEETKTWNTDGDITSPSLWQANGKFSKLVSIDTDKKTGLITLSVDWSDPGMAAQIANTMIDRINDRMRMTAAEESARNLEYLRKYASQVQITDIKNAWSDLILAETKKLMLANVSKDYAFKIIDPAIAPEQRIKPKRSLIVLLGLIFGIFSALVLTLTSEFYKNVKSKMV